MNNQHPFATILVHGGAGTLFKSRLSKERETQAEEGLKCALDAGMHILKHSGSALDAVQAAVCALEDCEVFNAGKGSVFTHQGSQEMDAAIMDGLSRQAGAVASVSLIRNPIALARKVLDHSPHVLLIGSGAEQFAREQAVDFAEPEYFYSEYRWQQLLQIREQQHSALDHDLDLPPLEPDGKLGTVGAVALDHFGNVAAATSTGGMTNKRYGRVGDSPLIGCGTYADNQSCAVSATGHGEFFIRSVLAHDVAARMKYGNLSLDLAAQQALLALEELGGQGGLIAIDAQGHWAMPFNNGRMYRGWMRSDGSYDVAIYE